MLWMRKRSFYPPQTEESASADEAEIAEDEGLEGEETQEEAGAQEAEAEAQETEEAAEPEVETETVYLISKTTEYDADGNITGSQEYTYDELGRELSRISYDSEGTKSVVTYEYEFFDDGTVKKRTGLNEDNSISSEREYDAEGNEIYRSTNVPGAFFIESKYTYENGVKKTESTMHFEDASKETVTSATNTVYNEFGDVIQQEDTYYDDNFPDGSYTGSGEYTYEYNEDNLKTKKMYVGTNEFDIYEYDSQGNVILTESYDENGECYYKNISTFDEHNNITNLTIFNADDTINYYSDTAYTYDEAFNIIKYVTTDENGNITDSRETEYITMELPKTE
ncbi:MAG: hypothetical protein NC400_13325 [Clostridium sp.]|nr:hypothetical protein [Clostridium sp.]